MNKILVLLVSLIFINTNSFAQLRNQWKLIDTLPGIPVGNNLFANYDIKSADFADKNNFAFLAATGFLSENNWLYLIRTTTDGGLTWNTIYKDSVINGSNVFSLCHPSPETYILYGNNFNEYNNDTGKINRWGGIIKYSVDSCYTWNNIILDSNSFIKAISMLDAKFGIAYQKMNLSINDSILITENGWTSFNKISLPIDMKSTGNEQLHCYSKDGFIIKLYNSNEHQAYIYRTEDAGKNWIRLTPIKEELEKFKFISKDTGWVLTKNHVYKTYDGGKSWTKPTCIEDNIYFKSTYNNLDFADKDNGVIIAGSKFYITSDGGDSWIIEEKPTSRDNTGLFYILFPSKDKLLITGSPSYIIERTNEKILKTPYIYMDKYYGNYVDLHANVLNWQQIEGAEKYQLLTYQGTWDLSSPFTLYSDTTVSDTSITLPDLNYDHYYTFRLKAFNKEISSESPYQGNLYTKYNIEYLPSPILLYPKYYSDTLCPPKVRIVWTSNISVDNYDIEIYKRDDSNLNLLGNKSEYPDTSIYIDYFVPDTINIIKIRCRKGEKLSDWSYYRILIGPTITSVIENNTINFSDVLINPNPATNLCRAVINNEIAGISVIKLFNSLGIEINNVNFKYSSQESTNQLDFDVSQLNNGVYFLVLRDKQKNFIGSFVINR